MFNAATIRKMGASTTIENSGRLNAKMYMKRAVQIYKSLPEDHYDREVLECMFADFKEHGWDQTDIMFIQALMRQRNLL
jgi:hypothetical protein